MLGLVRKVVVAFKVDPELLEAVDEWCFELGVSRSELVRRALTRFLGELAGEHPFAYYRILSRRGSVAPAVERRVLVVEEVRV